MKLHLLMIALPGIVLCTLAAQLQAEGSIDLRVSENGRFLTRDNGSKFFPVADTAWAIAWKLNRHQVGKYLQRREEQKFNTIALVAFPSYEGIRIIPNAYGDNPFEVRGGRWNPLRPRTTPGRNPKNSTEYDYWDHLEYIIDSAGSRGLEIILLPAWGGCVAGDWGDGDARWESVSDNPKSEIIFDSPIAYRYGRWIGQRFKCKRNVIWMIGGDRSAVYGKKDYRPVFRAMAEGVADGVNGVDQQDGKADFSTTLMSYHPRKWKPNSSEWFHNEPWMDFNSTQDQPRDQIVATALDFGLSPTKPTWLFEGGYEFRGKGSGTYRAWQMRFQSYQTVFAGGFGITYGSMNIYHCREIMGNLDEEGALDMQHLHKLMTSMSDEQFLDRIPNQSLIAGDPGKMSVGEGVRSDCLQATSAKRGDYAMVYSANGRKFRLNMDRLSVSQLDAFWFNPRNGKWRINDKDFTERSAFAKNIPGGPGAPIHEYDPPGKSGDSNDWVLLLRSAR